MIFTETALLLPDQEIPYEDLFYRASDVIAVRATTLELVDRLLKEWGARGDGGPPAP